MITETDYDGGLVNNNVTNDANNDSINNTIDNIKKRGRPRKYTEEEAYQLHLKQSHDWKEKHKYNVKNLSTEQRAIIKYLLNNPIKSNHILKDVYNIITGTVKCGYKSSPTSGN
jgi:hypothetical protein